MMLQTLTPSNYQQASLTRYDGVRRGTYPDNPDSDTVALCEHFRIRYTWGRLLKALGYGVRTSAADLATVSGIPRAMLASELSNMADRVGVQLKMGRARDNRIVWAVLDDSFVEHQIRDVIHSSWHL